MKTEEHLGGAFGRAEPAHYAWQTEHPEDRVARYMTSFPSLSRQQRLDGLQTTIEDARMAGYGAMRGR